VFIVKPFRSEHLFLRANHNVQSSTSLLACCKVHSSETSLRLGMRIGYIYFLALLVLGHNDGPIPSRLIY